MTAMPASYTLRRPAAATRDRRAEIAAIISGQRFTLALQPVVAIASRAPDHAEALLRPAAPAALPPAAFVAAAEAEGLGPALDAAVLHLARTAPPPLSVNVCARSLQQHDFVRTVLTLGAGAIELVRLDAIDDLAAVAAAVAELRAGGVRVALDEVDGGAASLALLQAARFDALKLAGSVVRGAMAGERGRRLLAQLLRLAQALGARPIATHIETLPQLWAAERAGIDLAQGWLLGAPAPWPGATATA
jgi:EAL domain-containing protein (putative c-di-GMP-specific phosphodiesterase class I)